MKFGNVLLVIFLQLILVKNSLASDNISKELLKASVNQKDDIEINSDSLALDQEKQTAIFTGKVVATQYDTVIKADKMIAHYANAQNSINKIIVIGNVNINNNQQIATGNEGEYRVDDEIIELKGNVTLIKEKNIVKGDFLTYNLKSGLSKMSSNEKNDNANDNPRVKAIFTPKNTAK